MKKVGDDVTLTCPIPLSQCNQVLLAHGGGGKLMSGLINEMFLAAFGKVNDEAVHDSVVLKCDQSRLAFTTDSYVVNPLFFPGGDIGSMAVYGTVNDLAMSGATARYLSVGFIIEEGFSMETLWQVVQSMKRAADRTGVKIVTGDTKVVDRGKGDGIFINTSGIGFLEHDKKIHPSCICPGDIIIVNGDIARHGIAIMTKREGLEFESDIQSDCAPVNDIIKELLDKRIEIHCLRDLTRGGLSSALNEIASAVKVNIVLDENKIIVREDVHGVCEMLGFDPLYVACEGRFVAFLPERDVNKALEIMKNHLQGENAHVIGVVEREGGEGVRIKTKIGVERMVDMISGEQLPRIC